MSKLQEKLERVAIWFDQNQKYGTPRVYWTIHQSSSKHSKGKTLVPNYSVSDPEASKGLLLESLELYAPEADKYLHIYLRSSRTDSDPVYNVIENPFANKLPSVSGSGNNQGPMMQGYSREDMEKIIEERVKSEREKMQLEIAMERQRLEFDRKLEDMQAAIEGVKENNQSMFERILGIAEHPVISSVLQQIAGKALGGGLEMPSTEYGEVEHKQDDSEEVTSEDVSLAMLDVFEEKFGPEQARQMIAELGLLAKKNPKMIAEIRPMVQNMIKGKDNASE
jgi:hypothetical protein